MAVGNTYSPQPEEGTVEDLWNAVREAEAKVRAARAELTRAREALAEAGALGEPPRH